MVSKLCTLKCNIEWRGWCLFIHRKKAPLSKLAKTWLRSATPIWWRTPATYGRNMWREISATRFASLKKTSNLTFFTFRPGMTWSLSGRCTNAARLSGRTSSVSSRSDLDPETLKPWPWDPDHDIYVELWSKLLLQGKVKNCYKAEKEKHRETKMAYVDIAPKAPRSIQKAQVLNWKLKLGNHQQ